MKIATLWGGRELCCAGTAALCARKLWAGTVVAVVAPPQSVVGYTFKLWPASAVAASAGWCEDVVTIIITAPRV